MQFLVLEERETETETEAETSEYLAGVTHVVSWGILSLRDAVVQSHLTEEEIRARAGHPATEKQDWGSESALTVLFGPCSPHPTSPKLKPFCSL